MPPDPSGAGKQALAIGRVVRAAGWDVTLLTDGAPSQDASPELEGFPVQRVPPPPVQPTNLQILAYWHRVAWALCRLRARFDVLQVHTADFHHVALAPVARLLGKGVVVRSSMSGEFGGLDSYRSGRLQKTMLGAASAFVVLSDRLRKEYLESGLPPSKLNLIPNGVDTTVYHPVSAATKMDLRRDLDLPTNSRIAVFHGVFIERKSLHWLVDVLEARLSALDLTLLFVGGPAREEHTTGYAAQLTERIRESPASDRIIVRGHDPAVHRYLQAADAYVLASTNEGLPNALLEAMAVGLVPIVSRTSGTEDVIVHGESGMLFEPRDADSLVERTAEVFGGAPSVLSPEIASNAVQRIRDSYSIEATARRYVEVYERITGTEAID